MRWDEMGWDGMGERRGAHAQEELDTHHARRALREILKDVVGGARAEEAIAHGGEGEVLPSTHAHGAQLKSSQVKPRPRGRARHAAHGSAHARRWLGGQVSSSQLKSAQVKCADSERDDRIRR
jgi:hypothetical protein